MTSYTDVYGLQEFTGPGAREGDLIVTGPNTWPRFKVIKVHEDRAWIRNITTGADAVVPVLRCKPINEA